MTKSSSSKSGSRTATDPAVLQLMALRQVFADRELWKTYQAADALLSVLGWELAERTQKLKKAPRRTRL